MTLIKIVCDSTPIGLISKINGNPVESTISNNQILIACDVDNGLHQLRITSDNEEIVNFVEFWVNGVDLRQTKYLSWVEDNNIKHQPATYVRKGVEFVLPFLTPVALWYGVAGKLIQNLKFGKNLYDEYTFFYPESLKISDQFPVWIQDFFEKNNNFTVIPNNQLDNLNNYQLPYYTGKLNVDFDADVLLQEVKDLFSNSSVIHPASTYDDKIDDPGKTVYWEKIDLYHIQKGFQVNEDLNLIKFIKSLPVKQILYSFIGKLEPGTYISPHRDNMVFFNKDSHCGQMYIPLNWPDGNYFKLQDVGLAPIKEKTPILINTQYYQHSLVNQGTETRYILNVWCDVTDHNLFDKNIL